MLDAETGRFVDAAVALPPAALATAWDRVVDDRARGGREASLAARPSAARDSALVHRVRSALLPRADELNGHLDGLHSDAKSAICMASRAVLARGRLTPEQYALLVTPFTDLGVPAPPHPTVDLP
ncbi:hypothetical protein HHL19_02230 [Streptomyces sp. R302]|uniref:hypothetical protein n=1 Tax=unclassified Streptomyces TaxID=2593676 RepID=UPI00145F4F49|nr:MULTISPECIES: hypothetical protein [unclassified Streptomyces]NML49177.1 hypothetical protein [Streptomyces sp. R301]NML77504.1 hypothetical protein [Streptomyces sp. R302]